jgi:NAD(P)-dependent dehydrogenase (short-subunit alcohol dehydrogenase family)
MDLCHNCDVIETFTENSMSIQLRPLQNQVTLITGTSSGIGLVTARMAAEAGARVVLVGRDEMTNRNLAVEIRAQGGQAIYVIADVGKEQDVDRTAADAIEACGTFNTWVNNACVSIFGRKRCQFRTRNVCSTPIPGASSTARVRPSTPGLRAKVSLSISCARAGVTPPALVARVAVGPVVARIDCVTSGSQGNRAAGARQPERFNSAACAR